MRYMLYARLILPQICLRTTKTNVLLPLPVEDPDVAGKIYTPEITAAIYKLFRDKCFTSEWNTYPGHYLHAGGWWTRCSAQVWNDVSTRVTWSTGRDV